MPLPVAHALLGATVVEAGFPVDRKERTRLYLIGAGVAVLPDFDLFFSWILGFGNRWHGAVTHSIVFAVILGLLGARLSGMCNRRAVIVFSLASLSHGILDTITRRQFSGSALLWPFSRYRFKLGWFDYFAFYPASWLEPLPSLIRRAMVISAYELMIFGLLFATIFLTHQLIARRALKRQAGIKASGKAEDHCAAAD